MNATSWIVSADLTEVAGGTDLIKRTLKAFVPDSVSTTLLVDLHTYDCWPALASLEDTTALFANLSAQPCGMKVPFLAR